LSSAASSRFKRWCLLPGGLEEVFILLSTTVAAGESMESAYSLLDQEGGRVVECYLRRALRKRPNFTEFPSGGCYTTLLSIADGATPVSGTMVARVSSSSRPSCRCGGSSPASARDPQPAPHQAACSSSTGTRASRSRSCGGEDKGPDCVFYSFPPMSFL
jgi:hypothetical protein